MAAMGPGALAYVTRLAEPTKHAKYGELCTAHGVWHPPAAFNAYGGWDEEILNKPVERFFSRLRADEREAAGGIEWSILAKREFLFQCVSVVIARGNTMVPSTLRQGRQQQPSAPSKNYIRGRAWPQALKD